MNNHNHTTTANALFAPVLVLGGNGKTGKRIVQKLNELSIPVRVGSRSGEPAFDWNDRSTWEAAMQGMKAVYIAYQPDLSVPGAPDDIDTLVQIAQRLNIQKLVLLSGRGETEAQICENIVINSGIDYTILRCSWFFQNFNESFFQEPLKAGLLALPAGNIQEPFVDADDIADIAVAAFTASRHSNKLYDITGPRLLTFKDVAKEIGIATGRDIRFQDLTIEEYTGMLTEFGVPADYVQLITYLFTEVLDGRNESLAHGVEEALDRKPADISAFIHRTLPSGVWS
ncbi:NmrA family NAD(P)-binding protein [Pseudoflavitalea sp. G-6-1-2]|uniref:NAD(P)H-binding protein n=1 Tax=Pseudoflavitalea sp. G-6-1-2 TaxID=2728841 RepID=UPI00146C9737|nr:NmrA family NAD(P)-binding protein [Pseudoflavitalea sp. G-6-1-2]NML21277.1 NmrA family NAD(P)-binding protein [Pseudoflavitalea sp. G-6-1-2]